MSSGSGSSSGPAPSTEPCTPYSPPKRYFHITYGWNEPTGFCINHAAVESHDGRTPWLFTILHHISKLANRFCHIINVMELDREHFEDLINWEKHTLESLDKANGFKPAKVLQLVSGNVTEKKVADPPSSP